jgi:hypothetical protein
MVFTAPEFAVTEPVEMFDQVEIAAELQHRMLADWMMRGEEGAEIQTRNDGFSWQSLLLICIHPNRRPGQHGRKSPTRLHPAGAALL